MRRTCALFEKVQQMTQLSNRIMHRDQETHMFHACRCSMTVVKYYGVPPWIIPFKSDKHLFMAIHEDIFREQQI